jgi:hypothetical protein
MLKDYCKILTDEAQVTISIQLIKIILPVWNDYFKNNPAKLKKFKSLITDENNTPGDPHGIDIDLPENTLSEIEKAISAGKNLNKNIKLKRRFETFLEPLTIEKWNKLFPESVRLVFTSVFNLLSFLIIERLTPDNETHIYVSINMACDVILRENIMDKSELELMLLEYKDHKALKN